MPRGSEVHSVVCVQQKDFGMLEGSLVKGRYLRGHRFVRDMKKRHQKKNNVFVKNLQFTHLVPTSGMTREACTRGGRQIALLEEDRFD